MSGLSKHFGPPLLVQAFRLFSKHPRAVFVEVFRKDPWLFVRYVRSLLVLYVGLPISLGAGYAYIYERWGVTVALIVGVYLLASMVFVEKTSALAVIGHLLQRRAPNVEAAKAIRMLDVFSSVLPRRLATEDIGDAMEVIARMQVEGRPRWRIWATAFSAVFFALTSTAIEVGARAYGLYVRFSCGGDS